MWKIPEHFFFIFSFQNAMFRLNFYIFKQINSILWSILAEKLQLAMEKNEIDLGGLSSFDCQNLCVIFILKYSEGYQSIEILLLDMWSLKLFKRLDTFVQSMLLYLRSLFTWEHVGFSWILSRTSLQIFWWKFVMEKNGKSLKLNWRIIFVVWLNFIQMSSSEVFLIVIFENFSPKQISNFFPIIILVLDVPIFSMPFMSSNYFEFLYGHW